MRKPIAVLAVVFTACASTPEVKAPVALNVQVDSKKAEVSHQTLTGFQLTEDVTAQADQPGVTATGAHWELVFDGNVVASGDQKLGTAISSTEPTALQLQGEGAIAKTAQDVQKLSEHQGGYSVALRGTLDFSGPNGATGKAEFARATFLREPRMPQVVMVDVGASHYDDGHVNLTFNIGLDNPNPFPVPVEGFKYKIDINGQQVADSEAGAKSEIPASSKRVFEVTQTLDPTSFKDLDRIYKTNSMKYQMTGVLDVGLAKFDVDMGAPINFTH